LFTDQIEDDNLINRHQSQNLLTINWVVFTFWAAWSLSTLFYLESTTEEIRLAYTLGIIALVTGPVVFLALKAGYLPPARLTLIASTIFASGVAVFFLPQSGEKFILLLMLPLAVSGMVLDRRGLAVVGIVLVMIVVADDLLAIREGGIQTGNPFVETFRVTLILTAIIIILLILNGARRQDGNAYYEEIEQIKTMVQSLTDVTPQTDVTELHQRVIRLMRNSFGYDFAQIYLLNDHDKFSRRVRAGIRSMEELPERDMFSLGDANARSEAARVRQIVQVTAYDPPGRSHHLLPSIQQGIIVPMISKGKSIGIIDVQRVTMVPLTTEEMQTLQIIANEVAALTVLLGHVATRERDLREQEAITNRLLAQLTSVQAQRQQLIGDAWGQYIERRGRSTFGYDLTDGRVMRAEDMTETMRSTLQNGEPFITIENDEKLINVPILLRGQVLGAMSFAVPVDRPVTERQIELASTVALRLGSALESTRLLEQTQAQANRERKANEISNLLINTTDIDTLLELAADNFNDTLGAIQTRIYIEPQVFSDAEEPANGNNNSNITYGSPTHTNGDGP
ncbi:MAG: GAF domain-containing protein, partial [Chloroflexota bacterium]